MSKGKAPYKGEEIIPMSMVETTQVSTSPGLSIKKRPIIKAKFKSKVKCVSDFWFGGIGILEDELHNKVDVVYPNYPAEAAGLKAGDIIMLVEGGEIKGDPGTTVKMEIFRPSTNSTLTFSIVRDKICYGTKKETTKSP